MEADYRDGLLLLIGQQALALSQANEQMTQMWQEYKKVVDASLPTVDMDDVDFVHSEQTE